MSSKEQKKIIFPPAIIQRGKFDSALRRFCLPEIVVIQKNNLAKMFFHQLLLHPQHKMQLSLPWMAATLGPKKLKKDQVITCNIIQVCENITVFIQSDSLNPRKRFSLRLSAILINGLCQIYRQQVNFLQEEIYTVIASRDKANQRRSMLLARQEEETPLTPKPAIKKRAKPKADTETPESLVERIGPAVPRVGREGAEPEFTLEPLRLDDFPTEEHAVVQARISDITLREEDPRPQEPKLSDDFGPFEEMPPPVPGEPMVEEMAQPVGPSEEMALPVRPIEEIVTAEIIQSEIPGVRVEEPPEIEPAIQVITEEFAPAQELDKDKEIVAPELPREAELDIDKDTAAKKAEKDKKVAAAQDLTRIKIVEVAPEPQVPTRQRTRNIAASLLLKTRKKTVIFINQKLQIYEDEPQFIPITNRIPDFKPMKKFWADWDTIQLDVERVQPVSARTSAVTEGSLTLATDKTAETPGSVSGSAIPRGQQIETPTEITTPGPGYVSTPKKRPYPSEVTTMEVLPPAANGEMAPPEMLPRKRKKVVSIEDVRAAEVPPKEDIPEDQLLIPQEPLQIQTIELEIGPAEDQPPVLQEVPREQVEKEKTPEISVQEEAPRRDYPEDAFGKKWSARIMQVVYQKEKIGPVDICKALGERLTKMNMATIFASLLALAKDEYVMLHNEDDSCELKWIEKGPNNF